MEFHYFYSSSSVFTFSCIFILLSFPISTIDSLLMRHTKNSARPNSNRINVFNFEPISVPDPSFRIKPLKSNSKVLVCYYNTPHYNDLPFPLFPEQIPSDLCTHLIVAFAQVQSSYNKSFTLGPGDSRDLEFYIRTVKLKLKNPELKVLLSVAGSNGPNETMSQMMESISGRASFINSSMEFLKFYNFDGLDVDWEFPSAPGQKQQFVQFLSEFRAQIETANENVILTAALGAQKLDIDTCYWDSDPELGIPAIANSVDFANIMTYDYHYYSWMTPMTGPNAPLYNISGDFGYLSTENGAWSMDYWAELGMPREKLVMGVPLYGRTFELVDEKSHDYYSLADGPGMGGPGGYLSYPNICKFLAKNGTSFMFNDGSREAYAWNSRDWVSFDIERSVEDKATHVLSKDFGGIMVYNLNSEDAWKLCKNPDGSSPIFPRVQKIKNVLFQ